jgi:hypothetical protein
MEGKEMVVVKNRVLDFKFRFFVINGLGGLN